MKKISIFIMLLLIIIITGCDKNEKVIEDIKGDELIDISVLDGEYYTYIDNNRLNLDITLENGEYTYFISYYFENENHASEELSGVWDLDGFNTKDNNVMYNSLANYDIKNIKYGMSTITLDIKLTDYITDTYKDYVIPDNKYTFKKVDYIIVGDNKLHYGTYTCDEIGREITFKKDGTFIEKYNDGYQKDGTFKVEKYDMSQDNSNDLKDAIVIRTKEGSHGGFIASSDYSIEDQEWFIYEFTDYDKE